MKTTLLLCFIHGFKGGDDTFGSFPEHLRAMVSHALPSIEVAALTCPKFETRGDLLECVGRFREWLQNKVIDLEVTNGTPSPTIDPSVHTILLGHSMGGIVAAETVLAMTSELPLPQPSHSPHSHSLPAKVDDTSRTAGLIFPHIIGILAFDTPYLGIHPGVVAHGAEGHYNTASTALAQLSALTGGLGSFWGASTATTSASHPSSKTPPLIKSAPPPPPTSSSTSTTADSPATPWQRWSKLALYATAATATATAVGTAAYLQRDTLTSGLTWASSHLEFIGCLARGDELQRRLQSILDLRHSSHNLRFTNLHTVLGAGAAAPGATIGRLITTGDRTFCSLPKPGSKRAASFTGLVNDKAEDEVAAHMMMFYPRDNPGFYHMGELARDMVVEWLQGMTLPSTPQEDLVSEEGE